MGICIDLDDVEYLRIEGTDQPDVWRIALPRLPWKYKHADAERRRLILRLGERYPSWGLWLSDIYYSSDEGTGWHVPAARALVQTLQRLGEGGWGLFFFDRDPGPSLPDVDRLPADPRGLRELVGRLQAAVAIVSWYDDKEWTVACRPA